MPMPDPLHSQPRPPAPSGEEAPPRGGPAATRCPIPEAWQRRISEIAAAILGERRLLDPNGPGRLGRLLFMRPSYYRPHPYMLYELNPHWSSPDGRARHSSAGFRGREIEPAKPAGRFRVVCMGESTTYCTGIWDDAATYPARLESHLKALRPDLDLEVINAGIGGYTSAENVLRCLFHVAPLSPDLIVFYYTHNDVHPRRMPQLSRDYREYSRSWYEPPFGGGLRGLIARRRALATGDIGNLVRRYDEYAGRRAATNVRQNPPVAFRGNMTALTLIAKTAGARVLFVNPPYRDLAANDLAANDLARDPSGLNPAWRAVWEHRRVLAEIAAAHGAELYDLASEMPYPADPKAFPNENYLDPVHVNERGADIMGRLIAQAILKRSLLPATT
jgi:lysophospholipase L1-like esterase